MFSSLPLHCMTSQVDARLVGDFTCGADLRNGIGQF